MAAGRLYDGTGAANPETDAANRFSGFVMNLAAARSAQAGWAATAVRQRLRVVRRLRHLLAVNAAELAEIVHESTGAPVAEVLAAQVLPLADACRFLEAEAPRLLRPRRLGARLRPLWLAGVDLELRREPYGIVLVIGPANYPLFLPAVHSLQALVAGNAVVLKPGVGGAPAATAFARWCDEAGLDRRLLQVLPESPAAAHDAIAGGVDKVVLTGSADSGRQVLELLADQLVPATLELSGCDAAFVRADADIELAARALRFGLLWNGGRTCVAPRRVFAAASLSRALADRLCALLAEGRDDRRDSRLNARTSALIRATIGSGGRLVWGSEQSGPAVVVDVPLDAPLLREELFDPVVAIAAVADDAQALATARQCPYALGASVFGEESAARALARRIHAGVVVVNDVIVPTADPRLPFGGRGQSGYGVTRGAEGLLEMTTVKTIAVRRGQARWHLQQGQFSDAELVRRYLEAVHGRGWWQRCRSWCGLCRHLIRVSRAKSTIVGGAP